MNKIMTLTSAAAFAFATAPAFAGSLAEPVVEAAPPAPAPVYNTGGDWGGFYGGLQLGRIDVDTDGGAVLSGDDALYGLHAGYNWDLGTWVVGVEADYDFTDVDLGGAATVDSVARLKLRGGYDFGRTLVYATVGAARVDTSLGNETGEAYGLGVSYQLTDQWIVGGEYLAHNFDDINGSGVNADADTLSLRASFRF
ncbi:MAG: porin [Sulfitobacter sp.]